jgi:hypothetical protein
MRMQKMHPDKKISTKKVMTEKIILILNNRTMVTKVATRRL